MDTEKKDVKAVAPVATPAPVAAPKAEPAKAAVKTAAKKPAAKKPAAKKPAKKAPKKAVVPKDFQIQSLDDKSIAYKDVVKKVNKAIKGKGKDLKIYVKAEEGKAYFTTADESGEVVLF